MKRIFFIAGLTLLTLIWSSGNVKCQYLEKKTVSLELAKKIAATCEAEAVKNKWTVVIAVVDDGGNLVYLERMDNTQIGSVQVATEKARTAIYFKRPTKAYEERVAGGNNAILSLPNVLPFDGGLPLIVDGQYIGAVGVSGGSSQQDGVVAKAGADLIPAK
jgi:uncharacterized protein GlcG (DUF336 family)